MNITLLLPSLGGGGAERIAVSIANHLNLLREYNVQIVVYTSKVIAYSPEVEIISIGVSSNSGLKRYILRLKRFYKLYVELRNKKTDLVISFMPNANLYAALLKIFLRYKLITTFHVYKEDTSSISSKPIILKFIISKSDRCIAVSNEIKHRLIELTNLKSNSIKVIYNFNTKSSRKIDRFIFDRIDEFKGQSHLIASTARLSWQKGQWLLINAISKISKSTNFNVKLVIFGDGELYEDLKNLSIELGVIDKIYFAGFVENPALYYCLFDVFVLTSLYEGFPVSIIEAMSEGLPIISTNCKSGPREILSDNSSCYESDSCNDYGVLVKAPSLIDGIHNNMIHNQEISNDVASQIIELINKDALRNKFKQKSLLRSKSFNSDKILKSWETLIRDL